MDHAWDFFFGPYSWTLGLVSSANRKVQAFLIRFAINHRWCPRRVACPEKGSMQNCAPLILNSLFLCPFFWSIPFPSIPKTIFYLTGTQYPFKHEMSPPNRKASRCRVEP